MLLLAHELSIVSPLVTFGSSSIRGCGQMLPHNKSAVMAFLFGILLPMFYFGLALAHYVRFSQLAISHNNFPLSLCIYQKAMYMAQAVALTFEGLLLIGVHYSEQLSFFEAGYVLFWSTYNYSLILSFGYFVFFTIEAFCHMKNVAPSHGVTAHTRFRRARVTVGTLAGVAAVINLPRVLAYTFNSSTGCFELRQSQPFRTITSIYNLASILLFYVVPLMIVIIVQIIFVLFLLTKKNSPSWSLQGVKKMREIRKISLVVVGIGIVTIFVEILGLILTPIKVALFFKTLPKAASFLARLAYSREIAYAAIATEYLLISLFMLVFGTVLNGFLVRLYKAKDEAMMAPRASVCRPRPSRNSTDVTDYGRQISNIN